MTHWKSPVEETKKGAAPSPSPSPHHFQPNQKPGKGNCTEAVYKAESSAWAQSSTAPSTRWWAGEDGCAGRDQSILWLHTPGQTWAVPPVWGWTHRRAWESCCTCWGCLVLLPRFNWEVPHEEETTSSTGEGSNGTREESKCSLRSIPPMPVVRSSSHRRSTWSSTGNDRTVRASSI